MNQPGPHQQPMPTQPLQTPSYPLPPAPAPASPVGTGHVPRQPVPPAGTMTGAPQVAQTNVQPPAEIRIALLAYSSRGAEILHGLIANSGLAPFARIVTADMANHAGLACDIAFAAFTKEDGIDQFVSDIASVRLVLHVPAVIGVIADGMHGVIREHLASLETDDIVYMPVNPRDFSRLVMTHAAALRIRREHKTRGFGKKVIRLGSILVEHGLITPVQLKRALDYQKTTDMRLGDVLVMLGYLEEEQKVQFLASQQNVEIATSKMFVAADINTVALVPAHIARRNHCIALQKTGNELVVAMTDVSDLQLLDNLRDITEMRIKPILGTHAEIETSVERFYRDISSQTDASNIVADMNDENVEYTQSDGKLEDISVEEAARAGADMGIVKLVNMLVANAVRDKASDIHIEPGEKDLNIRYRIDGDLRQVMSPPKRIHQAILTRIKILSDLDIAERRLPQDGRMGVRMGHREIDIRVSILPSVFGEKAVLRILDKEAFERSVTNLGFSPQNVGIFTENIRKPYGMIIVTGPTGSGKSTTLYSAMQEIKSVTRNIITVEDPVEFHMHGLTQVSVNTKIGMTFGAALRSILRQDPDIILIGEIRDDETADIAIKMALTGHLVFSTLHTNDASSTIARFIDIGIPPLLLGSSLNLIIAQRLVRRICPQCKVEYKPEPELVEQLDLHHRQGLKFYKGEGCVSCNGSGYSGRVGLFELLNVTKDVRKLILRSASTIEIQEQAEKDGMQTLRMAGIQKVLEGETTVEQVIAVTTEI